MRASPDFPGPHLDDSSRDSSAAPRTPQYADEHRLHANMNHSTLVHNPLYPQYSLPSDSGCSVDQLGHAGNIPYTNSGVSDSSRRGSELTQQPAGLGRPLGQQTSSVQDSGFHPPATNSEALPGSMSTSPSSHGSSVAYSFTNTPNFPSPALGLTTPSLHHRFPGATPLQTNGLSSGLSSYSSQTFSGMQHRHTDNTNSFLPSHRHNPHPLSPSSNVRERYLNLPGSGRVYTPTTSSVGQQSEFYRSSNYLYNPADQGRLLPAAVNMAQPPSSSGYGPADTANTQHPPFSPQENHHKIYSSNNEEVIPHIEAKIEKGFFLSADGCFTCYRRNYFAVQCSYSLSPHTAGQPLYLLQSGKSESVQIQALAMSLSAAVDGAAGKSIELVQHTPKRDKGPQIPIQTTKLCPTPPGGKLGHLPHAELGYHNAHMGYGGSSSTIQAPYLPLQHIPEPLPAVLQEDPALANSQPSPTAHQHTFERIQFKSATANNGKRRAQQQYYHLIVELYADIQSPNNSKSNWVKICQRSSSQVVVRGRSPSHYQNEGPNSAASRGGGTGAGGGAGYSVPGGMYGDSFGGALGRSSVGSAYAVGGAYRGNTYAMEPSHLNSHASSVESFGIEHAPQPMIMTSQAGSDYPHYSHGLPPIKPEYSIGSTLFRTADNHAAVC